MQPRRLQPVSIALVNSIGNIGGFLGPFALGWMHDHASGAAPCERPGAAGCTARWSSGAACIGALAIGLSTLTASHFGRAASAEGPRGSQPPAWTGKAAAW